MFILIQNQQPYISRDFLLKLGIDSNTLKVWKKRYQEDWVSHLSTCYFAYDRIPDRTKSEKNIPAASVLIKEQERFVKLQALFDELCRVQTFQFSKYTHLFQHDPSLTTAEITEAAKLHAVWNALFELRERGNRDLLTQYEAFRKLYPEKFKGKTGKNSFSNVLRKGRDKGVQALAVDRKKYGNNREENAKKNKAAHKYFVTYLAANPNKWSCTEMLEKVNQACDEAGLSKVTLSWVKKQRAAALRNIEVFKSRYGSQEANKKLPSASLINAQFTNQQWQLDGMTMPFWGPPKFKRYTLVRIVDSCSKKVIGWSFGESENSVLIIEAIRDAVNTTGCLPFEVLTDNHSFNQTGEAKYLQGLFEAKGSQWTVTQNPQYKAIIERYNQHLDKYYKDYFGYLGQGIRSKGIEAHPKPELIDKYCKQFIEANEQKAITLRVIEKYNSTPLSCGKSPNQLYNDHPCPHPITADIFERAQLLISQTEKKIVKGQVTFLKGIIKHEFQLPSALYQQYNDKTVIVRYESLNECIDIFDKATGEGIDCLYPKQKIHNAKANQNSDDIDKLNKHTGRLKGIKSKASKQVEAITAKAHLIDPEAYIRINRLTTPKNVIAELEQEGLLIAAEERGIEIKYLHVPERSFGEAIEMLKPKVKINDSPFAPKNHTVTKFKIEDILND